MSIKLQNITTSTNLDLTDKVLISDGDSEHLVTVQTLMGAKLNGVSTSTSVSLSDKLLLTNGTTEKLVTVSTLVGAMHPIYRAKGAPSLTVPAGGGMYKVALTETTISVGSGFSISNGGVLVAEAGVYRVTGFIYGHNNTRTNTMGVFLFYGTTFVDGHDTAEEIGATEIAGVMTEQKTNAYRQVTDVAEIPAGNTIFLAARSLDTASIAYSGHLIVERLA